MRTLSRTPILRPSSRLLPHSGDRQQFRFSLVLAQAGEIDAEIVLETAQHDLHHLGQVLVRADGMCGAIQQLHAFQLYLEFALGEYEIFDVGIRAEPLEDAPGRITQRYGACLEPAIDPVEAANAETDVIDIAAGHHALPFQLHLGAIFGMNLFQPAETQLLRLTAAGVVEPLAR